MTRVPWTFIVGVVLLIVGVLAFPLIDGYGRQGPPSIENAVGQQAFVIGAAIAAIVGEAVIRSYQWFLSRFLARVAASLDSDSIALLVLAEWRSPQLSSASLASATKAERAWLRGFPYVLIISPAFVNVRSPSRALFSFTAASVHGLILVKKPGRKQPAIRLVLKQSTCAGHDANEYVEFFWIDIRSGVRPVSDAGRIEKTRASVERALHRETPAGELGETGGV